VSVKLLTNLSNERHTYSTVVRVGRSCDRRVFSRDCTRAVTTGYTTLDATIKTGSTIATVRQWNKCVPYCVACSGQDAEVQPGPSEQSNLEAEGSTASCRARPATWAWTRRTTGPSSRSTPANLRATTNFL